MGDQNNRRASEELDLHAEEIARAACERLFDKAEETVDVYGERGRSRFLGGARTHIAFLSDAVAVGHPELFVDYARWSYATLVHHGFTGAFVDGLHSLISDVVSEVLPPSVSGDPVSYLTRALECIREMPSGMPDLPSFMDETSPLSPVAHRYLDALVAADRDRAVNSVVEAVSDGAALHDVYAEVIQRSQRELGRKWQLGEISVAQEHFGSAVTQVALSQLYPFVRDTRREKERNQSIIVAACANELHEIGTRIVADNLEADGWDVTYLGGNQPSQGLVELARRKQARVVALSVTVSCNLRSLEGMVQHIRENSDARVMVGGYPFQVAEGLWREVGADACGTDASDAVRVAQTIA